MESLFGKKNKPGNTESTKLVGSYNGKTKTGSSKTKLKSPKTKVAKPVIVTGEKKPRKPKERMERVLSSQESGRDPMKSRSQTDSIPAWIQESSEKKSIQKPQNINASEKGESKLQWRKETKKSQRSFSKNKEKDHLASKPRFEKDTSRSTGSFSDSKPSWKQDSDKPRTPFGEKKEGEYTARKSSWDKNSTKPGTGFEKSKTGYKGVGTAWDKSSIPRKSTRTWDTETEKSDISTRDAKQGGYKGKNPSWEKVSSAERSDGNRNKGGTRTFPKPSFDVDTTQPKKTSIEKEIKYVAPKQTWEKDSDKTDKKSIKDPTKYSE